MDRQVSLCVHLQRLSVSLQNYYEKMEKRQEKERDSSRKEHTTKLITPQVAKVEHTYRPGEEQQGPSVSPVLRVS